MHSGLTAAVPGLALHVSAREYENLDYLRAGPWGLLAPMANTRVLQINLIKKLRLT